MSEESMCYVGFAECGCAVAATVDRGDAYTAADLFRFVLNGYRVKRRAIPWVRQHLGHHPDCAADNLAEDEEEPAAKFWTCREDEEELRHTDVDDAVDEWLDDMYDIALEEVPPQVKVYGFRPRLVDAHAEVGYHRGRILEDLLERIDEDYGSPDGGTEPTTAMKVAEDLLLEVICREYEPWACEPCVQVVVDTAPYVEALRELEDVPARRGSDDFEVDDLIADGEPGI